MKNDLTKEELKRYIDVMTSSQAKEKFLLKQYSEGNRNAFILLKEILDPVGYPYSKLLEQEIAAEHATGNAEKIVELGKEYIDHPIMIAEYSACVRQWLDNLKQPKLIDYYVDKLEAEGTLYPLLNAVEFLKVADPQSSRIRPLLEKIQPKALKSKHLSHGFDNYIELDMYREAATHYFVHGKDPYQYNEAWKLAKEHVADMLPQAAHVIYLKGFDFFSEQHTQLFYEVSKYLDESQLDTNNHYLKQLNWAARDYTLALKCEKISSVRFYHDLACVLYQMNENDLLAVLLENCEIYSAEKLKASENRDLYKEMADLYFQVRDRERSLLWTAKQLSFEFLHCNPSQGYLTIKDAIDMWNDPSLFQEELIQLYEKEGNFRKMSEVYASIGKTEQAEILNELVEA